MRSNKAAGFLLISLILGGSAWWAWLSAQSAERPAIWTQSYLLILVDNGRSPWYHNGFHWTNRLGPDGSVTTFSIDSDVADDLVEPSPFDEDEDDGLTLPDVYLLGTPEVVAAFKGCGSATTAANLPPIVGTMYTSSTSYSRSAQSGLRIPSLSDDIVRLDYLTGFECTVNKAAATRGKGSALVGVPRIHMQYTYPYDKLQEPEPSADESPSDVRLYSSIEWVIDDSGVGQGYEDEEAVSADEEMYNQTWTATGGGGDPAGGIPPSAFLQLGPAFSRYSLPDESSQANGLVFLSGVLLGGAVGSILLVVEIAFSERRGD